MNRRGFLSGCIAASTAPAFVKADNLMGLWIPKEPTYTFKETHRNGEVIVHRGVKVRTLKISSDGVFTYQVENDGVVIFRFNSLGRMSDFS